MTATRIAAGSRSYDVSENARYETRTADSDNPWRPTVRSQEQALGMQCRLARLNVGAASCRDCGGSRSCGITSYGPDRSMCSSSSHGGNSQQRPVRRGNRTSKQRNQVFALNADRGEQALLSDRDDTAFKHSAMQTRPRPSVRAGACSPAPAGSTPSCPPGAVAPPGSGSQPAAYRAAESACSGHRQSRAATARARS